MLMFQSFCRLSGLLSSLDSLLFPSWPLIIRIVLKDLSILSLHTHRSSALELRLMSFLSHRLPLVTHNMKHSHMQVSGWRPPVWLRQGSPCRCSLVGESHLKQRYGKVKWANGVCSDWSSLWQKKASTESPDYWKQC